MFWPRKKEVIPEVLRALRNKLPERLEVALGPSEDGGYVAQVVDLPGCFTEGDDFKTVYQMINAAIFDYYEVPKEYIPHLHNYEPPKEVIDWMKAHGDELPLKNGKFVFELA